MAANCGRSKTEEGYVDNDGSLDATPKITASNHVTVERLHGILTDMARRDDEAVTEETNESNERKGSTKASHQKAAAAAMKLGTLLWGLETREWNGRAAHPVSDAPLIIDKEGENKISKKKKTQETKEAHAYTKFRSTKASRWIEEKCRPGKLPNGRPKKTPNQEQRRLLERVAHRCAVEEKEFRTAVKPKHASEPVRACLLAPPGTGKTQTILWLLEFFDEVCLWENGVQYQTLASQNTMAAAICGNTNHSWGEVPINASGCNEASVKKNKDGISTLFLKCLSLRWLIPDEISTSGLIVLGILESNVRKACRQHLHAYNKQGEARAWGGLNLIISGDWLQLPPVSRAVNLSPRGGEVGWGSWSIG